MLDASNMNETLISNPTMYTNISNEIVQSKICVCPCIILLIFMAVMFIVFSILIIIYV